MSKARELANLGNAYSDGALSNRNLLINSAMQVAQRGTVNVSSSAVYGGADRWKHYCTNTGGSIDVSQDTDAPDGFAFSHKLSCSTTGNFTNSASYMIVGQEIEGQNVQHLNYGNSSAKQVTLSFWVKSNKTGVFNSELRDVAGSYHTIEQVTINSADTWEYKTVLYSANTLISIPSTNGQGLRFFFWLKAGSNFNTTDVIGDGWVPYANSNIAYGADIDILTSTSDYFAITGVQLEIGDTSTPFEHRSYADQLQACQRYYYQVGGAYGFLIGGYASGSADDYNSPFAFPVTMRTAPSVAVTGTWSTSNTTASSPSVTRSTSYAATVYGTTSVSGNWYMDAGSADDLIKFDAEL